MLWRWCKLPLLRFRVQPWQLALAVIAACAGVLAAAYYLRSQRAVTPASMVQMLPPGEGAVLYIDVGALRRSGTLDMITGGRSDVEEPDYRKFVAATQFDYTRDLDSLAALLRNGQQFYLLHGRFSWPDLKKYAEKQGGTCVNGFCSMPASTPQRFISFYPLRSDLMGMAVSGDNTAAYMISRHSPRPTMQPPPDPVWLSASGDTLKNLAALPSGTHMFATALGGAESLLFTLGRAQDHLAVRLDVTCTNAQRASSLLVNLENATSTLDRWLEREHQQPNPRDLSGVLTAGVFRRDDRRVHAEWPLRREFLEAVAGGTD